MLADRIPSLPASFIDQVAPYDCVIMIREIKMLVAGIVSSSSMHHHPVKRVEMNTTFILRVTTARQRTD